MSVNTNGNKVGRPTKNLKMILNKSFTFKDISAINPDVHFVTVRSAVLRGLKNGTFTKLNRVVKSGLKGKPAHLFINTKVYKANLNNLSKVNSKIVVSVSENVQPVTA